MDPLISGMANLGGMGLFAAALFLLHRDALKAFREELKEERRLCTEALIQDRAERLSAMSSLRQERQEYHIEVIERLERIEQEVKQVKILCGGK